MADMSEKPNLHVVQESAAEQASDYEIKTLRVLPGKDESTTPEMTTDTNEVLRFVSVEDQRKNDLIEMLDEFITDVKKGFITSIAITGHGKLADGGSYLRNRVMSVESSTFVKGLAQEMVDYVREVTEHGRETIGRDEEEPQ